jgi:hypothetical protein
MEKMPTVEFSFVLDSFAQPQPVRHARATGNYRGASIHLSPFSAQMDRDSTHTTVLHQN